MHTLWKVFQASQTSSLECLYEIERSNHPSNPFSKSLVLIASRAAIFSQPSYWAFLDLLHVDCLCFVSQMLDWLLVFWKKKVNTTNLAKQCTSTKALDYVTPINEILNTTQTVSRKQLVFTLSTSSWFPTVLNK